MAWRVSWSVVCDHCRAARTFAGAPSSAVEQDVRRLGWVFTIDEWGLFRHLCPRCGQDPATRRLYETALAGRPAGG